MVADDLISVARPGQRRAVPFRGNLKLATAGAVASIAIAIAMWVVLVRFDQSLVVNATQSSVARAIEGVLAVAVLSVPLYGIWALIAAMRGERLARQGERHEAQIAVEDARDRLWVVVGLGLSALVITFLLVLL